MLNPFSTNPDASAWGDETDEGSYLFNKIHSSIVQHLEECVDLLPNVQPNALRIVTRAPPMQVVKLWQFVHPASIQKTWNFEVEQVSRSHSATLMKCLSHYVAFVNKDPRLVVFSEPGNAIGVLNAPLHRFDTGDIAPVGSVDNSGAVQNMPNKIGSYQVWVGTMKVQFPDVPILESLNSIDITEVIQWAVFPMRIRKGTGNMDSFTMVFIPAFRPLEENREILQCKRFRIGTMLWGSWYIPGGGFDETFTGYMLAVPSCMVKAQTNEPFLFRTCRTFKKLNRNSAQTISMEATVTLSMKPQIYLRSNKQFLCTHAPATANKFNVIVGPYP